MKVNLTIVRELLTLNKDVAVLINKMQRQSGHLDERDMTVLKDLQLKIKFHVKHHPEEWKVFQSRDALHNTIDGVSLSSHNT